MLHLSQLFWATVPSTGSLVDGRVHDLESSCASNILPLKKKVKLHELSSPKELFLQLQIYLAVISLVANVH